MTRTLVRSAFSLPTREAFWQRVLMATRGGLLARKGACNPVLYLPVVQTKGTGHYDRSVIGPVRGIGGKLKLRVFGRKEGGSAQKTTMREDDSLKED